MKYYYLFCAVVFITSACSFAFAQNQSPCSCEQEFDAMSMKLEVNYVGYHLTKNQIAIEYATRKQKYRVLAAQASMPECTKLMQDFLQFFGDGHLFVVENPKLPPEELALHKTEITTKKRSIDALKPSNQEPLEGYWTDGTSKYVIVKNSTPQEKYEFVAVIVDAPDKTKIGEVKFGVSAAKGNEKIWEGIYYTNAYTPRYVSVTPYKDNTLLSVWGGILWGRLDVKNSVTDAVVYKPDEPTVRRLNDQTMLLTIPSFLIEKSVFDKVLQANAADIGSAKYLIIDIRGNTGGNGIYLDLLRAWYEKPIPSKRGWAVSSPDNIVYFSKFTSLLGNDPYSPVVADMKATPGAVVKGPNFKDMELQPIPTALEKIVILTDRGNKSAAETFILHSKAVSTKVITMGENTGGVVDYNNINMIKLSCEKQGIAFGYPTYTLHDKIPQEGYNKTGIMPDVRIDASVKDKVAFAVEYLQNNLNARKK